MPRPCAAWLTSCALLQRRRLVALLGLQRVGDVALRARLRLSEIGLVQLLRHLRHVLGALGLRDALLNPLPRAAERARAVGGVLLLVLLQSEILLHDRQGRIDHRLRIRIHVRLQICVAQLPRLHVLRRLRHGVEVAGLRGVLRVLADVAGIGGEVPRLLGLRRDVGDHLSLILL